MATEAFARDCAPVVVVPARGGDVAKVQCSKCGAKDEWRMLNRCPPARVRKTFTNRGWLLGRKPICPTCKLPCHNEEPNTVSTPNVTPINANAPQHPNAAAATDAARLAKRLVLQSLEDGAIFDEAKRRYAPDWSDARIAKETGISEATVAALREEFFGKLAEPSELEAFRADFADYEARAAKSNALFSAELAALKLRLSNICKKNGWAA